jgi:hypothetical protein
MYTMIKCNTKRLLSLLMLPLLWSAACNSAKSTAPTLPHDVATLKTALDPIATLSKANAAGYATAITDCMSNGAEGAMGVHWGNPALIDSVPDALHPEALIFEPAANGDATLVGVEFIVPFAVRPRTATAPVLFGQSFTINDQFSVWALHVWTHRTNPSGLFATWNPRVHC